MARSCAASCRDFHELRVVKITRTAVTSGTHSRELETFFEHRVTDLHLGKEKWTLVRLKF